MRRFDRHVVVTRRRRLATRELDPRIDCLRKIDCRLEPGNDEDGAR